MNPKSARLATAGALAVAAASTPASTLLALAGLQPRITEERAVVVWLPERKIQRVFFRTVVEGGGSRFALLVPTPTPTTIGPTTGGVFQLVERYTATKPEPPASPPNADPRRPTPESRPSSPPAAPAGGAPPMPEPPEPENLERTIEPRVTFETEPVPAASWPEAASLVAPAGFPAWFGLYAKGGWSVTALRILPAEPDARAPISGTYTFAAEVPYYPYRRPAGALGGPSQLRLTLLSTGPASAALSGREAFWGAEIVARRELSGRERARLLRELNLDAKDVPSPLWLTTWQDNGATPRESEIVFQLYRPAPKPAAPPRQRRPNRPQRPNPPVRNGGGGLISG